MSSGSTEQVAVGKGADTQGEIFAATERLLERVSVHELSVAQIIEEAGVSRATFYFYFSSKYSVIVGLLTGIMDQVYEVARPFIERADDESPQDALWNGISAAADLWRTHRLAMRAVSEYWPTDPELRQLWLGIVERFTDAFAQEIDRQRKQGLASPGPPSRELVATLLWGTERCFYVGGLGVDDGLNSEEATAKALYAVWEGALYGGLPSRPSGKRGGRSKR